MSVIERTVTVQATAPELRTLASRLRMDAEALEHASNDERFNRAKALRARATYFDTCADAAERPTEGATGPWG